MDFFDWFFGSPGRKRDTRKRVFISFAIEDIQYRDFLVEQARKANSPFDFIDMSVKEPWNENEWKARCRSKIKRCHRVIVLISKNTWRSGGARWEMKCTRQEGIKMAGMHIKKNAHGAIPPELKGCKVFDWSWGNLQTFLK
jgi:hypothetical protein